MDFPVISAATAGALLILQQLLMLTVGLHRTKVKTGVGHGDDRDLERLIRRHGNLAENAGIFIVTLALLELVGGAEGVVLGLALAFVFARIAHVVGFSSLAGSHLTGGAAAFMMLRAAGAMTTAVIGVGTGGYLLYRLLIAA